MSKLTVESPDDDDDNNKKTPNAHIAGVRHDPGDREGLHRADLREEVQGRHPAFAEGSVY